MNNIKELITSKINAWALWENESMNMPDVLSPSTNDKLKPEIIFLGLNPSKSLKKVRNFHSESVGDKRLKQVIQGHDADAPSLPNLSGAFMTDLTDKIESNSSQVNLKDHSFLHLESILKKLGQDHYHLICFGVKAYDTAKNWLLDQKSVNDDVLICKTEDKPYEVTLYKVMHFSYRFGENKIEQQLSHINDVLRDI